MKTKHIVAELLKLDQEEDIFILDANTCWNEKDFYRTPEFIYHVASSDKTITGNFIQLEG